MSTVTIEVICRCDQDLLEQLVQLEKTAFPARMVYADGTQYYRECIEDDSNINVVMRDKNGEVSGYVVAIPQSKVFEDLHRYDKEMKNDLERLYVDTIQTMPGKRQTFGILKLLYAMIEEAGRRGLNKFSMHARKSNGLSNIILKVFPTTACLRTIKNWYDYGEPFDYIEGTFTGKRR